MHYETFFKSYVRSSELLRYLRKQIVDARSGSKHFLSLLREDDCKLLTDKQRRICKIESW